MLKNRYINHTKTSAATSFEKYIYLSSFRLHSPAHSTHPVSAIWLLLHNADAHKYVDRQQWLGPKAKSKVFS